MLFYDFIYKKIMYSNMYLDSILVNVNKKTSPCVNIDSLFVYYNIY